MDNVKAHAFVTGIVQGVFFRATTVDEARRTGSITGWVRNLPDGRVEVLAEGPREAVENLIKWLHIGPSGALVSDVTLSWEKATGDLENFTVRH